MHLIAATPQQDKNKSGFFQVLEFSGYSKPRLVARCNFSNTRTQAKRCGTAVCPERPVCQTLKRDHGRQETLFHGLICARRTAAYSTAPGGGGRGGARVFKIPLARNLDPICGTWTI